MDFLVSLLTGLFVFLSFLLGVIVLLQQGKGDMGMGGLGAGSQILFGGSGGQDFFEKVTWTFGFLFIFGALGLSILKSRNISQSKIAAYRSSRVKAEANTAPVQVEETQESDEQGEE
jgi:preprotein translocase subunit SecG